MCSDLEATIDPEPESVTDGSRRCFVPIQLVCDEELDVLPGDGWRHGRVPDGLEVRGQEAGIVPVGADGSGRFVRRSEAQVPARDQLPQGQAVDSCGGGGGSVSKWGHT